MVHNTVSGFEGRTKAMSIQIDLHEWQAANVISSTMLPKCSHMFVCRQPGDSTAWVLKPVCRHLGRKKHRNRLEPSQTKQRGRIKSRGLTPGQGLSVVEGESGLLASPGKQLAPRPCPVTHSLEGSLVSTRRAGCGPDGPSNRSPPRGPSRLLSARRLHCVTSRHTTSCHDTSQGGERDAHRQSAQRFLETPGKSWHAVR